MKAGIRCIEKEKEALLKYKDELIDEYSQLFSWKNEKYKKDCCKWSGVSCDNQTNHIVELDLGFMHLRGNISVSLLEIQHLKYLDLRENDLNYSRIPQFISSLGDSPCPALSFLLTTLDLSHNMFNGTMTQCIGNLSKLKSLFLYSNNLEEIITESNFFNLSQLQVLDLSYNLAISFNISLGWNPPFQLTRVNLASSKVGPHFPSWFRTQTRLRNLDISNAEISDTFPNWFLEQIPKLSNLNVSHNNFHGVLPDLSSKSSTFKSIDLSFNHFNGSLPILPPNGSVVDLSSNKISGSVTNICNETDCYCGYLDLSNNILSEQLSNCFLTGNIPTWVGDTWTSLVFLSLRYNEFFGSIPSHLCRLADLQVSDLSLNKISGGMPKCVNNLTAMIQVDSEFDSAFLLHYIRRFESAFVTWKGKDAEYINSLNLVMLIDLLSNNLVGDVPAEISSLVMLVGSNLSRNNLSGFLPPNIERLRSLDFLDFARNHFSGGIPTSVSQLDQLGVLDLSYNNLSGKIPQSIHLRNPELCGLPLTKACSEDEMA
ncbi:putative leucine-rich repeat receptor-like serine/threonine-protein kinase At2g24130 [Olea europaea var. sylvestris]|uniref:putative leucine-rich repeat receptor-like serine/threonine-protein kinase At2g24130 n=1 Tax=Olea europaea var. sylvestris TaxID=158386 RepID=UPI000C1D476E|nr:putative leucine-rich repeat receptor-like serine/threonine-protein kinase At2g24130 [Olea europaea var. sylvestris]